MTINFGATVRRILLIDDHPLFCRGFAATCRAQRPDFEVAFAGSMAEARRLMAAPAAFNCVLIDVMLPDADGVSAMQELAQIDALMPRIIVSGRDDRAIRLRARNAGASGFISKAASPEVIMEAIDRVLAGDSVFDAEQPEEDGLRPRQLEVLELLAEGCANKDIEKRLNLAGRTVRAHLTTIFKVLGVQGRARAVLEARRLGLIQ